MSVLTGNAGEQERGVGSLQSQEPAGPEDNSSRRDAVPQELCCPPGHPDR